MTSQAERRTYLYSIEDIVGRMRDRIEDLCSVWELDGVRDGRDFVCFNPFRSDRSRGSFRVCLSGQYRGKIKEFAGDQSWTPLQFTADLWFGGDNVQAIKWAKGWLGLDESDPNAIAKQRRERAESTAKAAADDEADALKRRNWAYRIYLEAGLLYGPEDQLLDTPVARYLRGRGIALERLPFPLRSLRFHPKLFHKIADRHFWAMVASINGPEGQFMGVHRTWLQEGPNGTVIKADLPPKQNKKCLGPYQGGMIRLWGGTRVDEKTGEILPGRKLGAIARRNERQLENGRGEKVELDVTEGIEDGMSVVCAMPELRVAAGVSVSNMGGLKYPPAVGCVNFWKQNDAPGSKADKAFGRVVANAQRQGKEVRLVLPPDGVKDANDVLQRAKKPEEPDA